MNSIDQFQRNKLAASVALAVAISSGFAHAQEELSGAAAQTQGESGNVEQLIEEVLVAGIRASLIDSIGTKRDSTSIVEVISAEDIGKLPDSSIAESLARLPGLAAQRLDGRASRVSIRGFGEDEGATTFNGREQVSIGDNRGVEFDLYPSEIMTGIGPRFST